MVALCLEGGGARGAYQAGVVTTLYEYGYRFNAVTGTSIGALNAVMVAQDRFSEAYKLWETMEFSNVFDFDSKTAEGIAKGDFSNGNMRKLLSAIKKAVQNKGLDTSRIKGLLQNFVDEDILRDSPIEFGIMTVSLNELKPFPLYKEDMPEGTVASYIMASANFPGFEKIQIGENTFVDGGAYDNLPLNMLTDKGYTDIIAVETMSNMPKKPIKKGVRAEVLYIKPSEKPGRMLEFNNDSVKRSIEIGRYDALRMLHGYIGEKYYIALDGGTPFGYGLLDLPEHIYIAIASLLDIKDKVFDKDACIKHIISTVNKLTKSKYTTVDSALLAIIERVADELEIERLKIYKYSEFLEIVFNKIDSVQHKTPSMIVVCMICYAFNEMLKVKQNQVV